MRADTMYAPESGGKFDGQHDPSSRPATLLISAVLLMQVFLLALGIMLFWLVTQPVSGEAGSSPSNVGQKPNGERTDKPSDSNAKPRSSPDAGHAVDLAQLHERFDRLANAAGTTDGRLTTIESQLTTIAQKIRDFNGVSKEDLRSIASQKTLKEFGTQTFNDFGGLQRSVTELTTRLGGLEMLVSEANTRAASAADVIVIACDSHNLRFRQYSEAYLNAVLYNPDRTWFKNHRVALWIARGKNSRAIVPIDTEQRDVPALENSIKDQDETDLVSADVNIGQEVLERLSPDQRRQTRIVLVVPAGTAAPHGGWEGVHVDILLVASGRTVLSKESARDWFEFCASRNGLLAMIRPAAPVAAASGNVARPKPGGTAAPNGTQTPNPTPGTQTPNPTPGTQTPNPTTETQTPNPTTETQTPNPTPGTQTNPTPGTQTPNPTPGTPKNAVAQPIDNKPTVSSGGGATPALPPKEVIVELERELRRLIQPMSPSTPGMRQ